MSRSFETDPHRIGHMLGPTTRADENRVERPTRAEEAALSLQEWIQTGRLRVGAPINVREMARSLKVAVATMREGLAILDGMHLVTRGDGWANVASPTPEWFAVIAAECAALSALAVETAINVKSDEQWEKTEFIQRARQRLVIAKDDSAVTELWHVLDSLASLSENRHLARAHHRRGPAFLLGASALQASMSSTAGAEALDTLTFAMTRGDAEEAVAVVRDVYDYVVFRATGPRV